MKTKNTWELYSPEDLESCDKYCRDYMTFLSCCKTERECIRFIEKELVSNGYRSLDDVREEEGVLKPGDKIYHIQMGKSMAVFNIGREPLENGMNILGAHIDSPRIDLKQNPLFEDGGFALLDTHYYGGIKKYQWVTIPLSLHGIVVKKDGSSINLSIGEDENDPVFFISDLLIHLAEEQMEKKAKDIIEGELLDIIAGNKPIKLDNTISESGGSGSKGLKDTASEKEKSGDDDKTPVKAQILKILKDNYGIEEEDFLSAEIEIVPAGPAREAGLDRSMILGYGQDDRVCAYSSYKALLEAGDLNRTTCCILTDKEEIGSVGATGAQSRFFENTVAEVMLLMGCYSDITLRRCLARSRMLSSDVNSAFDPSYASSYESRNASYLGKGLVISKFSGSGGKFEGNDANPEFLADLRRIFDENHINFQAAEIGKVDLGGGGTIAYILAQYGMEVVDCGIALLNMHAPWEAASKADVYELKRGYTAFINN